jgi:hypothetical protein
VLPYSVFKLWLQYVEYMYRYVIDAKTTVIRVGFCSLLSHTGQQRTGTVGECDPRENEQNSIHVSSWPPGCGLLGWQVTRRASDQESSWSSTSRWDSEGRGPRRCCSRRQSHSQSRLASHAISPRAAGNESGCPSVWSHKRSHLDRFGRVLERTRAKRNGLARAASSRRLQKQGGGR